jgi:hypothetical protein
MHIKGASLFQAVCLAQQVRVCAPMRVLACLKVCALTEDLFPLYGFFRGLPS